MKKLTKSTVAKRTRNFKHSTKRKCSARRKRNLPAKPETKIIYVQPAPECKICKRLQKIKKYSMWAFKLLEILVFLTHMVSVYKEFSKT